MIYGNPVGGAISPKTFELQYNNTSTPIIATVVGQETIFDATENDVRKGMTFASNAGVKVGTKDIPAYRTTQGVKSVKPGESFSILLKQYTQYDYTKLQCLISKFNTSIEDSVAVDKIVIDDSVYAVNSTALLSSVTKNSETESIDLNITNSTNDNYVLRYFTYREEVQIMAVKYAYAYAIIDLTTGECIQVDDTTNYCLDRQYIPIDPYDEEYLFKYYYPIPESVSSEADFQGSWYYDAEHTRPFNP